MYYKFLSFNSKEENYENYYYFLTLMFMTTSVFAGKLDDVKVSW